MKSVCDFSDKLELISDFDLLVTNGKSSIMVDHFMYSTFIVNDFCSLNILA